MNNTPIPCKLHGPIEPGTTMCEGCAKASKKNMMKTNHNQTPDWELDLLDLVRVAIRKERSSPVTEWPEFIKINQALADERKRVAVKIHNSIAKTVDYYLKGNIDWNQQAIIEGVQTELKKIQKEFNLTPTKGDVIDNR